jgi:two-component system sensor histidine kinase EvgS
MVSGCFDGMLTKPIQQKELFRELAQLVPFTEVDKTPTKEEEIFGIQKSDEKIRDRSRLIEQLEKEILQQWQQVCQSKIFSEIEKFAERVRAIGSEHSAQPLVVYGKTLKIHSSHFAIEKIKAVLYVFPDLIEELRAQQLLIEKKEE